MKKFLLNTVCLFLAAVLFWGCSIDGVVILEHPDRAQTGETITVELADIFVYISNSSMIAQSIIRDSIHAAVGLPAGGYSVVSMKSYAAVHFRPFSHFDPQTFDSVSQNNDDTLAIILRDSLSVFKTRMTPMNIDAGMTGFFVNRDFSAELPQQDTSIDINSDSVFSWHTFSNIAGISIPTGTRADITVENTDTSLGWDSISYTMIPVYITAEIKVGTNDAHDTLFYYTKTDSVTIPDSGTITVDIGSMAGYIIAVGAADIMSDRISLQNSDIRLSAYPNPFTTSVNLSLEMRTAKSEQRNMQVGIYDAAGRLVWSHPPKADRTSHVWDGTNNLGHRVNPGTYVVRARSGQNTVTKTISFVH
jgi:hypothetical protein